MDTQTFLSKYIKWHFWNNSNILKLFKKIKQIRLNSIYFVSAKMFYGKIVLHMCVCTGIQGSLQITFSLQLKVKRNQDTFKS